MFRQLLGEKVNQIENDLLFANFNSNEQRIQHIFDHHFSRNEFRNFFITRTEIVRSVQKSYEMSKQFFDRAKGEFERRYRTMKAENLGPEEREVNFAQVFSDIENAILYAPHERQQNQFNILFNAYILRLKVDLKCNLRDNFFYDYTQAVSLRVDRDLTEQFDNEIDEWIPRDMRQMIENENFNENVVQTEYMPSLRIDDRCVFVTHPERGRYMIAKQSIEANVVLIEERPNILGLEKSKMNEYCSYCYVKLENGFYPCFHCIECRFCDAKCAQKASDGSHRFECGIVGYIELSFGNNWLLGYRVLTSLGINNINQLYNIYLRDGQGFDLNEWILQHNNELVEKSPQEILRQYEGLSSFVEHSYRNSIRDKILDIFEAIEIALLIEEINVFNDLTNDQNFIRLVSMLIIHYSKVNSNGFRWRDREVIGEYLSLVSTMVNHSCVPNTLWRCTEGKHTLTTMREIEPEEEICLSYGEYAFVGMLYHPFMDRQTRLRKGYNFICDCLGCKRDKSTLLSIMKCRVCAGTVYYGDLNPNRICIDCRRIDDTNYYDNRYQNIRVIIDGFDYFAERDIHTEESISSAEEFLQLMSERCQSSSPDLIEMREKMDSIRALHGMPFSQYSDRERRTFFNGI